MATMCVALSTAFTQMQPSAAFTPSSALQRIQAGLCSDYAVRQQHQIAETRSRSVTR